MKAEGESRTHEKSGFAFSDLLSREGSAVGNLKVSFALQPTAVTTVPPPHIKTTGGFS